jgi:ribonuclease HI
VLDLVMTFDGSGTTAGNPGGWGVVLQWKDGGDLTEGSGYIEDATNNIAEYTSCIEGLKLALEYQPRSLTIRGDSQLVMRQLTGQYKVKKKELQPLNAQAKELLNTLRELGCEITYEECRGHGKGGPDPANERADFLAGRARTEGPKAEDEDTSQVVAVD